MDRLPVADRWFETKRLDDSVTLLWEPHVHPVWQANVFHVRGRDRDLLVDAGMGVGVLRDALAPMVDKPLLAFATHRHVDHVGGLFEFDDRVGHAADADAIAHPAPMSLAVRDHAWMAGDPAEYLISAAPSSQYDPARFEQRAAALTRIVGEGDVIDLGDRAFEVLHLPGHTPGSIGLWDARRGMLFAGDALYDGQIFDVLPESNIPDYQVTMARLAAMPIEVMHGGHGPSTDGDRARALADAYLRWRAPSGQ